jgi:hypothetical protein
MNDPKRLLDSGADELEQELLASALADRGSDRALQSTLLAIGAGAGAALGAATAAHAASTTGPTAFVSVLKWLTIGATAGLMVSGGADWANQRGARSPEPQAVALAAPPQAAPPQPAHAAPEPASEIAAGEPDTPPPAPAARSAPAPTDGIVRALAPEAPSVAALPETETSSELLMREVQMLDRAKRSLARGDAAGALAALGEHARAFPRAALRPEADLLRMRALLASGDRAAALGIARRLVAQAPQSAHARAAITLLPEAAGVDATNP